MEDGVRRWRLEHNGARNSSQRVCSLHGQIGRCLSGGEIKYIFAAILSSYHFAQIAFKTVIGEFVKPS